ncbi:Pro-Pol polyprotein [Choanephora cucurbitarum]|uniref:Pro-Pol polyprotein n=1 Tax=Choanephora cucurbitarum TaxID=101091 RepID=A0A1C7MZ65_9FUNG|nr:Pro-Pol polyprotein [Choanephora cucurbitarum]
MNNILPHHLSRLYEPFTDHKRLVEKGDKRAKKAREAFQTKRLNRSKEKQNTAHHSNRTFINKMKQVYSHDNFDGVAYIAPPENERDSLLREYHALGHYGEQNLVKQLHNNGIHWQGLYADVKAVCKACITCAQHNVTRRGCHELKNILAYVPFDHIGIDLLGPLPETERNNRYVLVIIDIFTRYIIARSVPNKQSDTVAEQLTNVMCEYGFPRVIQMDNGREFKNSLICTISRTLGFKTRYSTVFYSRGNGAIESAVKVVLNTLRKMVDLDVRDWDKHLPAVQLAVNLRTRYRPQSTPFSLMFARQLNKLKVYNESDQYKTHPNEMMTLKELQEKTEYMSQVFFRLLKIRRFCWL